MRTKRTGAAGGVHSGDVVCVNVVLLVLVFSLYLSQVGKSREIAGTWRDQSKTLALFMPALVLVLLGGMWCWWCSRPQLVCELHSDLLKLISLGG